MRTIKITVLLAVLLSMAGAKSYAYAYDIYVANDDGITIYYNYINNKTELEVTYLYNFSSSNRHAYSGNVVIPESVTYGGKTYSVTSIGEEAFSGCI